MDKKFFSNSKLKTLSHGELEYGKSKQENDPLPSPRAKTNANILLSSLSPRRLFGRKKDISNTSTSEHEELINPSQLKASSITVDRPRRRRKRKKDKENLEEMLYKDLHIIPLLSNGECGHINKELLENDPIEWLFDGYGETEPERDV